MKLQILVPQYRETEDIIKPLLDSKSSIFSLGHFEINILIYRNTVAKGVLMTITDNTINLQSILNAVNALPSTGGGAGEERIPTTLSSTNLHNASTDTADYYISGGTTIAYSGWSLTDYIPVESGKYYFIYSTSAITGQWCSKFDASKTYTSSFSTSVNSTDKHIAIIHAGHDGYWRISSTTAAINALEVYEVLNFNWEVSA